MQHSHTRYLCLAGFCFSLGFFCTNLGFESSSAAFVETIKASEPITSAVLAVTWGLEVLTNVEITSLSTIVCGVVLSTLGNAPDSQDSVGASFLSCTIVMTSNLCFSFRGLYQKLFQSRSSHSVLMDDLNLQYRMQQMGVIVFLIPTILWEGPSVMDHIYQLSTSVGLFKSGVMLRYIGLSVINAVAFASYK
jgi:drug/metabolite transporter (DMT)-like permease